MERVKFDDATVVVQKDGGTHWHWNDVDLHFIKSDPCLNLSTLIYKGQSLRQWSGIVHPEALWPQIAKIMSTHNIECCEIVVLPKIPQKPTYILQSDNPEKIKASSGRHLRALVQQHISTYGSKCSLNHIDVSSVTDMSIMFAATSFDGDISQWDVSNVTTMYTMFFQSKFTGDISNWDVSKVCDMTSMFDHSNFVGDISLWNMSSVNVSKLKNFLPLASLDSFDKPTVYHWLQALSNNYALKSEWLEHFVKLKPFLENIFDIQYLNAARYSQAKWLEPQLKNRPPDDMLCTDFTFDSASI